MEGKFKEFNQLHQILTWATPGIESPGLNLTDRSLALESSELGGSRDEFTEEKLDQGGLEFLLCSVGDREHNRLQPGSFLSHLLFHSVLFCFFLFPPGKITGLNSSLGFES